jgi:hypothetical protein
MAPVPRRCGIFGYYTYAVKRDLKSVLDTLFNGLKRLEYRGYDSAGVAVELVDPYPLANGNADGSGAIPEENGAYDSMAPLICKEVGKVIEQPMSLALHCRCQAAVAGTCLHMHTHLYDTGCRLLHWSA